MFRFSPRPFQIRRTKFLLLLLALVTAPFAAGAAGETVLNGAGASFPQPVYTRWFEKYSNVDGTVRFDYVGLGSYGGRSMILKGDIDFGASDVPIATDTLAASGRTIWHIPTVASAVAICHNVKGYPKIRIDGPTLAAIYLGNIVKWNDPALAALNPGDPLPDREIVVVHLSESGTLTDIFSKYLGSVSPEWKGKFGDNSTIAWPTGPGGPGNAGAAKLIRETPNSIGYLELTAARRSGVRIMALKNSAGTYVLPDGDSIAEAAATFDIPDDFRFFLVNAPGRNAYPIGIVTWMLVDAQQADPVRGRKLIEFLNWVYKDGEKYAVSMGFVPLPRPVCDRVLERLAKVKI
jgi:phosphate transport system substrate-binding protein